MAKLEPGFHMSVKPETLGDFCPGFSKLLAVFRKKLGCICYELEVLYVFMISLIASWCVLVSYAGISSGVTRLKQLCRRLGVFSRHMKTRYYLPFVLEVFSHVDGN